MLICFRPEGLTIGSQRVFHFRRNLVIDLYARQHHRVSRNCCVRIFDVAWGINFAISPNRLIANVR
jgi:hypothetical protein